MPKKTKKEKIIAELRRKLHEHTPAASQSLISNDPTPNIPQPTGTYKLSLQKYNTSKQRKEDNDAIHTDQTQLLVIRRDLYKTLLFTCIAIGVEFALFFMMKK